MSHLFHGQVRQKRLHVKQQTRPQLGDHVKVVSSCKQLERRPHRDFRPDERPRVLAHLLITVLVCVMRLSWLGLVRLSFQKVQEAPQCLGSAHRGGDRKSRSLRRGCSKEGAETGARKGRYTGGADGIWIALYGDSCWDLVATALYQQQAWVTAG